MSCPKVERCPLYPHFQLELSLAFWKSQYCNTDDHFETCRRYQMAESGEMPDPKMLPNGKLLGIGPDSED
jgi:hypothetical protein